MTISQAALGFDIPVMVAVALACLPIFFTGGIIDRWEGVLFLFYYLAYALYLFLNATAHDSLPLFSGVMMFFVIPITAVTLGVLTFRSLKRTRKQRGENS